MVGLCYVGISTENFKMHFFENSKIDAAPFFINYLSVTIISTLIKKERSLRHEATTTKLPLITII